MSFMSKFLVQGDDAGRLLDRLATAKVDGPAGTISYTQLLSPSGTLQADLTITKRVTARPSERGLGSHAATAPTASLSWPLTRRIGMSRCCFAAPPKSMEGLLKLTARAVVTGAAAVGTAEVEGVAALALAARRAQS